jgi:hypothetical protein
VRQLVRRAGVDVLECVPLSRAPGPAAAPAQS